MITIHIGLPRTASTYLQEKIFKNTHQQRYLPTTSEGSRVSRLLLSDKADSIYKLIYLIKKRQNSKNNQNVIISAEDLSVKLSKNKTTSLIKSFFNQKQREFNIDKKGNYKNFLINEAQILNSLSIANKFYKNITGKNLKVILGIRNQQKLLPSLYSANIFNRLSSSQKQFSKIVNIYTKSKCEFMQFDKWFSKFSQILGPENILIYESDAINEKILEKIILFSGGSWPTSFTSEKINMRNKNDNKWQIKTNKIFRNIVKSIFSPVKRGVLFHYLYRISLILDSFLSIITLSEKYITLEDTQKNQIKKMFNESNTRFLNLKKKHPNQILINELNW